MDAGTSARDRTGWSNSALFTDAPIRPYDSNDSIDVARVMGEAKAAGLDALVVSWAGKDFDDRIDHRRMVTCLTAAQRAGTKVAALLETTMANPYWNPRPLDADGLRDLLLAAWKGEPPCVD